MHSLFSKVLKKNGRKWREARLNEIRELAAAGNISILLYAKSDFKRNNANEFNISVKLYLPSKKADLTLGKLTGKLDRTGFTLPIDDMVRLISRSISKMLGKQTPGSARDTGMVLLLAPKYTNALSELQKKTRDEQNFVINYLYREHRYNLVYYAEFLRNNNISPFRKSEGKLVTWIKKNRIQRTLYMKVKNNSVTLANIVEGRPKHKATFDVDAPARIKNSKLNKIAAGFYIKPDIQTVSGNDLSTVAVNLQNVSFEIGFNPFYQFVLVVDDTKKLNFLGGGFLIHMRAPLTGIFNMSTSTGFSRSLFFGLSLHAAYIRENLIVRQTLPEFGVQVNQNLARWFQNYTVAFEVSYLYPVTPSFRAGLSLRPGYNIGFFGDTLSSPSNIDGGFALYLGLEANFLIAQGFSLNLGIGYSTHSLNFVFHGFYSSLGVSFLL